MAVYIIQFQILLTHINIQKTIEIKIDANQLIEKAESSYQENINKIEKLHNEIAKFSGIPLPEPVDENSESSDEQNDEQVESVDPKD